MKVNIILIATIVLLLITGFLWPETENDSLYPVSKVKIYVPSKPGDTTDVSVVRADEPFDTLDGLFRHSQQRELVIASQMGGITQLARQYLDASGGCICSGLPFL